MYPEDRVLVAIMPSPRDMAIVREDGWYRIPEKRAPKGVHAEYLAFYYNHSFGGQKWAIHYYARQVGYELMGRRDLLPAEPDHPRADELYFTIQLGPLQQLARPIVSLRWRRISFVHPTWDRFMDAAEINDLFVEGEPYVDRLYYALREAGIFPERGYQVREGGVQYQVDLAIPCRDGVVSVTVGDRLSAPSSLRFRADQVVDGLAECAAEIAGRVAQQGGVLPAKHQ